MINFEIIIPFRDRGSDPLRVANLQRVLSYWSGYGQVRVVDDGRDGDAQFCRSAAYNRGAKNSKANVLVYTESDMLVPYEQIDRAIEWAWSNLGVAVPFTDYHYLSEADSALIRKDAAMLSDLTPEWTMDRGLSVGAVNIISRPTLDAVGQWDEKFEGSWYDDRAMDHAFKTAAGPTWFMAGPAYHLYHLPGWKGKHLSAKDKLATAHNLARYNLYLKAKTPERIRELTAGGS